EALGVTQPPKVEMGVKSISLSGGPGEVLIQTLEVKTADKKPVHAYGTSDEPWVDTSEKAKLSGRVATLNIKFHVPDRPGETVKAKLVVHSNGNARFTVPVEVKVSGAKRAAAAAARAPALTPAPVPVVEAPAVKAAPQPVPQPVPAPVTPAANPFAD